MAITQIVVITPLDIVHFAFLRRASAALLIQCLEKGIGMSADLLAKRNFCLCVKLGTGADRAHARCCKTVNDNSFGILTSFAREEA
jgi:hypothetical protein